MGLPIYTGVKVASQYRPGKIIARMTGTSRASFILIPGAGGLAWYWHSVVSRLQKAGDEAIAVDLPADDQLAVV
jgi:hypothetical protein